MFFAFVRACRMELELNIVNVVCVWLYIAKQNNQILGKVFFSIDRTNILYDFIFIQNKLNYVLSN